MDEESKRYYERVKLIIAIIVTMLISICATLILYNKYLDKSGMLILFDKTGMIINEYDSSKDIEDSLDEVKTVLEVKYKGELDDDSMKQGAIKGYVEGVGDDYTQFLDKKEWDELMSSLSEFVGIGVYLSETKTTKDAVVLGTVGEDSPAAKAGIQTGDVIKTVNLEDVLGKGVDYVSSKVKGKEGSTVKVTVLRDDEELTFDIERKAIKMYEIKSEMLEDNIGYIDFDSFTEESDEEFKNAYESLKSKGAKSLIVDLRDNTGGYVQSALNIADLFIEENKEILITEDKDGKRLTNYSKTGKVIDIPVVVLVNDYSASASEILTGFLKDYGLAKIVGIKTFGKGVIQDITPLLGGALKTTIAEYFTPKGNKINKIGIEPDVEVELDEGITKLTNQRLL